MRLSADFRRSLLDFLEQTDNESYRVALIGVSFNIFEYAINETDLQPDNYMPVVDRIVKLSVQDIKISLKVGQLVDKFIRELSSSEEATIYQAFHVLNLAYHFYLKRTFEYNVKSSLFSLGKNIQTLVLDNHPCANQLKHAYQSMKKLIDDHFVLPPKEQANQYATLKRNINEVCHENREAIESSGLVKKIVYNLGCALIGLGIFYGIYLAATAKSRGSFFIQPDKGIQVSTHQLDNLQHVVGQITF